MKSIFAIYTTIAFEGYCLPNQAFPTEELAQEYCDYLNNPYGFYEKDFIPSYAKKYHIIEIPFNSESLVPNQ